MTHRSAFISLGFITATFLSGCSSLTDVSSTMRVDTGLEPENIDANVRFRTTYYFRVLTGCSISRPAPTEHESEAASAFAKRTSGTFIPMTDSLYRFRMTGQAAALTNRVHFESGILRKEQIDPFGSAVKYNEHTNSFIPLSATEVREDYKTQAARQDIDEFRKIYKDIDADKSMTDTNRLRLLQHLVTMIEDRLDRMKTSRSNSTATVPPAGSVAGTAPSSTALPTLTALEDSLSKADTALNQAQGDLKSATNDLANAKIKVGDISADLTKAKAALTTPTQATDADKAKIAALTTELSAAQADLDKAEANRQQAETQVATLTTAFTTIKNNIASSHSNLVAAKGPAVTTLQDLSKKIEALLTALGVATSTAQPHDASACNGKPSENKYYLLGPEGGKELDPQDRLLMALSVESKPLISALQQLSDRKFQKAGASVKTLEDLLEERGRILDARTALQNAMKDAAQESGPTDQSKLEMVLEALRKPYVATTSLPTAK